MKLPVVPRSPASALTSLILPTFNPGAALTGTLEALQRFLQASDGSWETIFVCDGSTDGSTERLAEWAQQVGLPVRVLSSPTNRGKGYAVRQGMLAAEGRFRIFTDVDLAYGFDDIMQVAESLWSGREVAIASRSHPRSEMTLPTRLIGYSFRRHVQSEIFGALTRLILPISHRDTQAGLKGMTAEVAAQIVPRLRCDGFGFDCELLMACAQLGIAVEEVPVRVRYQDAATTTNIRTVRLMIADLFRIRHRWRSGLPAELSPDRSIQELSVTLARQRTAA